MNPLHAEIAALRRRNDALEAENAILREDLAPVARLRIDGLELSQAEQIVLSLLLRLSSVDRERISLALWGDAPPASERNAIRVMMFRIRTKLSALDVEIRHTRQDGYFIPADQKARLRPAPGGRTS